MNRRKNDLPPIDELRTKFSYDPETGNVTGPHGRTITAKTDAGYIVATIQNPQRRITAHRLAFALMNGRWPKDGRMIDHINGDKADNRWSNLREVTASENCTNRDLKVRPNTQKTGWRVGNPRKGELRGFKCFAEACRYRQQILRSRPATQHLWRDHPRPKEKLSPAGE